MSWPEFILHQKLVNIVHSEKMVDGEPELAWCNIAIAKLHFFSHLGCNFIFDYRPKERKEDRHVFMCNAKELAHVLKDVAYEFETGVPRYNIYLDHVRGHLRAQINQGSILHLEPVSDESDEYEQNIQYMPKNGLIGPEPEKYIIGLALKKGCSREKKIFYEQDLMHPLCEMFDDANRYIFERKIKTLDKKGVLRIASGKVSFGLKAWTEFKELVDEIDCDRKLDKIAVRINNFLR